MIVLKHLQGELMNKTKLFYVFAAVLVFAALALAMAQDSAKVAKAPYLTDVAQAMTKAAESGSYALIYFFSPT